jgi:sugar phosphate isomerase/epimerase
MAMTMNETTRRQWLGGTAALAVGLAAGGTIMASPEPGDARQPDGAAEPFGYCLNPSTIESQKLDPVEVIEIAAKAGYQAIEPWLRDIERYAQSGGSVRALGQRLKDRGLAVPSAIGFAEWIVDDPGRRQKGLEQAKRDMDLVRQLGGTHLAAPPAGAQNQPALDLLAAADRYRALLELGDRMGVIPQVEVWGFSRVLGRLGEAALVAMESGHPKACILADVYHLYKGGSQPGGLRLLRGSAMHVMHFNDYPADPPRASITDAQRVYPGDGVAPLGDILRDLRTIGFTGYLSLELFNRDYWKLDPLTVARTGLEKMKAVVRKALA